MVLGLFRYLCRWGCRDSSVRGRSISLCPPALRRSTTVMLCVIIRHYCEPLQKRRYTFMCGSLALAHVSRGTVNMLRFLSLNPTTWCCSVLKGLFFFASLFQRRSSLLSVIPFPLLSRRLIHFLSGIWNAVPEQGERKLQLCDVHEVLCDFDKK